MNRILALLAGGAVVVASVWIVVADSWNRSSAAGGTMELTERELRLPARLGDSTAIFLEIAWDVPSSGAERDRWPDWLAAEKLAELGFDCRVPTNGPESREHYKGQPQVPAFVVLEYEGEAWKNADAGRHRTTRLFAVDAGRDAASLRAKYGDPARWAIVRAAIGMLLQERDRDGVPLAEPRLRGWIAILPDRIFVPREWSAVLQDLRPREGEFDDHAREPRFAAKVSWGRDHTPWIEAVRLLR